VDEIDDLLLGLQSEFGFESMLSDPYRIRFPNQLTCLRTQDIFPRFLAGRISRFMSIAGAE